ncbi:MAG: 50S ribosomal protein L15 [Desulfovibrionaceae bacterium]|nr:50S ribosomal protein L15 [Desulfovibrionaceae bacterium]
MRLHELYPFAEERKGRKRLGRGQGSGLGSSSGKGLKGQKQRSGGGPRPGFEGGQMPLQRRLPKHGFNNIFRVTYTILSLKRLQAVFADKAEISLEDIYTSGLAPMGRPVKILGDGEVQGPLKVEAHKFSASARAKLEQAGGAANSLEG